MESRGLVTVLLAALGVCLLVIGIFIGRETTRPPEPVAQPIVEAPPPTKPLPPIFEPPAQPPAPAPATPAHASAAPHASAPAIDPEEKRRVAQYLRDVDRLLDVDVGDPEASAQAMISGAASGDTSGLDKLVQTARDAERNARTLAPPPPCTAFHRKLLALLADSREMAQALSRGFQSGNLDSLPGMLSRANSQKARQESLTRDEKELKRRYGI